MSDVPPSAHSGGYESPFSVETYRTVMGQARCTCSNGEAEDDRGAVLRCAVHGIGAASDQEQAESGGGAGSEGREPKDPAPR